MGVRIGTGLSTEADARFGAAEAAAAARDALGNRPCDLALVFAAGAHLAAPEATLEGVQDTLAPDALIGCGAGGVIGESREVEALGDGGGVLSGLLDLGGSAGALMLSDPYTFPTDPVLRELSAAAPMLPLLGGLASARSPDEDTPLFYGDEVVTSGAVGARLDGVEILPCVSQGAT